MTSSTPFAGRHVFFRGRVGLYAILQSLGIGAGDEVATQAFTCIAVPEGIMASRARPVFVDIEADGVNMDPADLQRKLTPSTKAIVIQHTFGIPARLDALLSIAKARGLPVIEDCCHSHNSKYNGQLLGSFGDAAFFSYEWGKPMVLGLGGSVRTNQPKLARRLDEVYSDFVAPSANLRYKILAQKLAFDVLLNPRRFWPVRDTFRRLSRLGLAKGNYNPVGTGEIADDFKLRMLADLERKYHSSYQSATVAFAEHSRKIAELYQNGLTGRRIRLPQLPAEADTVFARFPLLVDDKPRLLAAARAARVEMADWYATPIHPLQREEWHLVHYSADSCPQAEQRAQSLVSLPTYPRVAIPHVDAANRLLREFETRRTA